MTPEQVSGEEPIDAPRNIGSPEAAVQDDYFGFFEQRRYVFPDKVTYIEFVVMNEGAKSAYQKKTNRDLVMERTSGNARMKVDQASDRHALITSSVTGWNLVRQGVPYPFTESHLKEWLDNANPRLVENLEKEIRKANPWLLAEMSSEDIQKEIDNLTEMLEVAKEREAGEAS
jgi:hypothetical protein